MRWSPQLADLTAILEPSELFGSDSIPHLSVRMLLLIEVILIATVSSVTVAESGRRGDYCKGETVYSKYPQCRCGEEFVQLVKKKNIPDDDLGKIHQTDMNGHIRHYICRTCSICEDGVEQIAPCRGKQDTMCGGCAKENHIYDNATKTCSPTSYVIGGDPEKSSVTSRPTVQKSKHTVTSRAIFGKTTSINRTTKLRRPTVRSTYEDVNRGTLSQQADDDKSIDKQVSAAGKETIRSSTDQDFSGFYTVVVVSAVLVIVVVSAVFVVFVRRANVCRGKPRQGLRTNGSADVFLSEGGSSEVAQV